MKGFLLSVVVIFSVVTVKAQQQEESLDVKYRRSSLYTVMIDKPGLPYADEIKKNFMNIPVPDKFNDHNLEKRIYTEAEFPIPEEKENSKKKKEEDDSSLALLTSLASPVSDDVLNQIARDLVAKWFNRSEKGGFDMELIKQRGSYDASALDVATAKASKRGLDMLADAGEELIGKTFVLVNEFKYTDKAEVAEKAKGFLNALGTIGDMAGISNASTVTTLAGAGASVAGKGYVVRTHAHLYQLVWDEETAAVFYNQLWADDTTITPEKKQAFDESTIFKLKYIGTDNSWADVQSSIFTNKSDEQLIERASIKSIDAVIVKLQKEHDVFKTKTPLYTGEPITAKIGLKEGLTKKSVFDVLEQYMDEDGKTQYKVVGTVKVDTKHPIWDNQYGAAEENPEANQTDRTYFKKVKGKEFYPGMLLVQKKGK
ncbi:MAG: hypothetical protein WCY89_04300 [Flavobacteriaceae bacterium]